MKNTNDYKAKLETELKTLENELKFTGKKDATNPNDWEPKPNMIDVSEAEEGEVAEKFETEGENKAVLDELEARRKSVADAIERIKNGTFGKCKICGKEIEEKRLEANPAADTWIEHKDRN